MNFTPQQWFQNKQQKNDCLCHDCVPYKRYMKDLFSCPCCLCRSYANTPIDLTRNVFPNACAKNVTFPTFDRHPFDPQAKIVRYNSV